MGLFKFSIAFSFMVLFASCTSELQKQNEADQLQADSLTTAAMEKMDGPYYVANIDSMKKIYLPDSEIKTKLSYAIALNHYSIDLNSKRDSIATKVEAEANAKEQKQIAEEKANWLKSKAGKIQSHHQDWSRESCQNLAHRQYWIGMTIDMLIYLRGRPNHINPSDYGSGIHYQWCWDDYHPSCFYGESDGIIKSYN
ncbi:MAG: hypothetical protein ABIV51_09475 [Saprospiraceae bacterium]